ncbi:helix-turn-helix transcriptional regulator [Echinicola sediminis]
MLSIKVKDAGGFTDSYNVPLYSILFIEKAGKVAVNFVKYELKEHTVLFLTPYQNLQLLDGFSGKIILLQFHGDFYCIEYHKEEVACNGFLFNNIYLQPFISLEKKRFYELLQITEKMGEEFTFNRRFSDAVLKSYLQLLLAICSSEKADILDVEFQQGPVNPIIHRFQELLEDSFKTERSPSFYAEHLAMSSSSLSKKIKAHFGKTPTQLIQERVILEAKKLLHLTHKPVFEIATELGFDDEFYFSRYFKKEVGLSPTYFRSTVGISIVAK